MFFKNGLKIEKSEETKIVAATESRDAYEFGLIMDHLIGRRLLGRANVVDLFVELTGEPESVFNELMREYDIIRNR